MEVELKQYFNTPIRRVRHLSAEWNFVTIITWSSYGT